MKPILRHLVLCSAAILFPSGALLAQTSPNAVAQGGSLELVSLNGFYESLAGDGITTTIQNAQTPAIGSVAFPITGGVVNRFSGFGEIDSSGGITFSAGSETVALQSIAVVNSPAGTFLTADVVVNGVSFGRQPVFQIVSANIPLPIPLGTISSGAFLFQVNPIFSNQIGDFFGTTSFRPGQIIGAAFINTTLVQAPPSASGQNESSDDAEFERSDDGSGENLAE